MQDQFHSCAQLIEYVQTIGILPLLSIKNFVGWSAEEVVDEECQYTKLPDGGWEWPLWEWKGEIIRESGCAYGKFFHGKAAFVSQEWWPHYCNYRRSIFPKIEEGSIEETILEVLKLGGSMTTRDLRRACGFIGKNERSKFDAYITRLQMCGRILTEDFVYPHDKHGNRYGWGWSLLNLPEVIMGNSACQLACSSEESKCLLLNHLHNILPNASEKSLLNLLEKK